MDRLPTVVTIQNIVNNAIDRSKPGCLKHSVQVVDGLHHLKLEHVNRPGLKDETESLFFWDGIGDLSFCYDGKKYLATHDSEAGSAKFFQIPVSVLGKEKKPVPLKAPPAFLQ